MRKFTFFEFIKLIWKCHSNEKEFSLRTPLFFIRIMDGAKNFYFDIREWGWEIHYGLNWPITEGDIIFKHTLSKIYKSQSLYEQFRSN